MWRVDSLEKTLMLRGIGAGGEGDNRGWDGWMASLTRWTWVWVNSRSWWWTRRPGMLWFMGSQRVGHDWVTELNRTEPPFHRWGIWATERMWLVQRHSANMKWSKLSLPKPRPGFTLTRRHRQHSCLSACRPQEGSLRCGQASRHQCLVQWAQPKRGIFR